MLTESLLIKVLEYHATIFTHFIGVVTKRLTRIASNSNRCMPFPRHYSRPQYGFWNLQLSQNVAFGNDQSFLGQREVIIFMVLFSLSRTPSRSSLFTNFMRALPTSSRLSITADSMFRQVVTEWWKDTEIVMKIWEILNEKIGSMELAYK